MKTKWRIYILWSVLSLDLLSFALDSSKPPLTRRKKVFKLSKFQTFKLPRKGNRTSSHRSAASASPLALLSSRYIRQGEPKAKILSDFAYLPDVSVTCATSDFVVRVKPTFYGHGADAEELKLGSTCKSNGVLKPSGDLLFTYPLTACDVVRESPLGYLLYKFTLHYEPSSKRLPKRIDVDIECRYQRNHHVHQLTVQPTWETVVVRKKLKGSANDFQMELMDDSWSRPAKSQVYQLGKTVNFQLSAPHLSTGGKLYINTCYASPSSGSKSLKYTIIDNFGCMLDSKSDPGASQFVSRTDETLRFSLKAFQFTSDPDTEINIHCKLSVAPEDPGPAHKSCTYRGNRWKALTGDDSICKCCDSQCVTSKVRRAMMEGSASSGSLLVSDQPDAAEDFLPVNMSREGEATINPHMVELIHSHEKLGESAHVVKYDNEEVQGNFDEEDKEQLEEEGQHEEVESEFILSVMTEPDLDEWVSEEDGTGYVVQVESGEEDGFEGREDETLLNEKAEVLHHSVQLEQMFPSEVGLQRVLQPSKGKEEDGKHAGRGEEHDRMIEDEWKNDDSLADLLDDVEITWYFTWR